MTSLANRSALRFDRASVVDRDAVVALSHRFERDYIPEVVDELLAEPPEDGGLYVARLGGQVVGCCAITRVGASDDFYLWAMRVHPEFQGHGIGGAFAFWQFKEAERLGARAARLLTHRTNERVQHMMGDRLGLRRIGDFTVFHNVNAGSGSGSDQAARGLRLATETDRDWCRLTPGLHIATGPKSAWVVGAIDDAEFAAELAAGRVWVSEAPGRAPCFALLGRNPEALVVRLFGGEPRAVADLVVDLLHLASGRPVEIGVLGMWIEAVDEALQQVADRLQSPPERFEAVLYEKRWPR